jgi:hypothetical protein
VILLEAPTVLHRNAEKSTNFGGKRLCLLTCLDFG